LRYGLLRAFFNHVGLWVHFFSSALRHGIEFWS